MKFSKLVGANGKVVIGRYQRFNAQCHAAIACSTKAIALNIEFCVKPMPKWPLTTTVSIFAPSASACTNVTDKQKRWNRFFACSNLAVACWCWNFPNRKVNCCAKPTTPIVQHAALMGNQTTTPRVTVISPNRFACTPPENAKAHDAVTSRFRTGRIYQPYWRRCRPAPSDSNTKCVPKIVGYRWVSVLLLSQLETSRKGAGVFACYTFTVETAEGRSPCRHHTAKAGCIHRIYLMTACA